MKLRKDWKSYNSNGIKDVFSLPWFSVEEIPSNASGEAPYYSIRCPDAVIMLAQTVEGRFIFVRQFRPPIGKDTLELPAGYVDANEDQRAAVCRELLEETGYVCEAIHPLGEIVLFPSRLRTTITAYFGSKAVKRQDKSEVDVELVLMSGQEIEQAVASLELNEIASIGIYYIAKGKGCF